MAEKANSIQLKRFYFRNRKNASELKTTTKAETSSLSYTPLLEPKLSILSSKLNKNKTETF